MARTIDELGVTGVYSLLTTPFRLVSFSRYSNHLDAPISYLLDG